MTDITLHLQNYACIGVDANERVSNELRNFLSAFAPNYRWNPKYKNGFWDGRIKFLKFDNTMPIGLLKEVEEFAKKGKYSLEYTFERPNKITREEFQSFVDSLNCVYPLRDYQFDAAYEACRDKSLSIESVTSSGKSLMIYVIIRFLLHCNKKILLIVNRSNLVTQLVGDFVEYGWEDAGLYLHEIYAGQKKVFDAPIIVSTWQSLYTESKLFSEFDALIIDEAHSAKANSLTHLAENAINAEYRIGFSGTYPDYKMNSDWYTITGNLGPIKTYSTYRDLQDAGFIAKMKIYPIILNYPLAFRKKVYEYSHKGKPLVPVKEVKGAKKVKNHSQFNIENDAVITYQARNELITKMVKNLDNNIIVLFQKIEKHGKVLKEMFERELPDKQIIYVDGSVKVDIRDEARVIAENNNNVVILASYGTFAEGVNIKNIHHVIFASSYKSKIKVLQSIGRGLRQLGNKVLKLYDIVDNLSTKVEGKSYINHAVRHYKERKKIYMKQKFDVKEITYDV